MGTLVQKSNIVEASLWNQRVPATIANWNEAEGRVGTELADVNQSMGQKVDSTKHGAQKGSEESLGLLSTTRVSSEDLTINHSHRDPSS